MILLLIEANNYFLLHYSIADNEFVIFTELLTCRRLNVHKKSTIKKLR